eukprot:3935203-Pyramimonas_sp.AAC.1
MARCNCGCAALGPRASSTSDMSDSAAPSAPPSNCAARRPSPARLQRQQQRPQLRGGGGPAVPLGPRGPRAEAAQALLPRRANELLHSSDGGENARAPRACAGPSRRGKSEHGRQPRLVATVLPRGHDPRRLAPWRT